VLRSVWHSAGRSAPPAAAPSGVVTFLFTDVEGSIRRWEADADGMRVALAAHAGVLRGAIEKHGGRLFKHTGDGVCTAFASPKSAVDAAVAAQRALGLPVRMGLATGEAELRDGDYFGAVLNRAARVMAAGHGGQILLADSTAPLLSGVELADLGPRRFRDLSVPVGLFQVRAAVLWDCLRASSTDSDVMSRRPPSPASPSIHLRRRPSLKSTPPLRNCVTCWGTRRTSRSRARASR
jgi:class 3 adenylate cyclase